MSFALAIFFGAIGGAYIVYAKKTQSASWLVAGVVLILYPYFVSGVFLTLLIGAVVTAVPFAIERGWF
jgi:hypothetical protein